jgi:hypothetical protein
MQISYFETMTRQEELHSIFWDMYKDAHGIRPRGIDTSAWTEAQFTEEFEYLDRVIRDNEAQRRLAEHEACHALEMRIQSLFACGAKDREMAIRWLHDAEGTLGDDEFLCYTLGLPYRYFKKETV